MNIKIINNDGKINDGERLSVSNQIFNEEEILSRMMIICLK